MTSSLGPQLPLPIPIGPRWSFTRTGFVGDLRLRILRLRLWKSASPGILKYQFRPWSSHGGADPCNDPSTSEGKERFFKGNYRRVVLDGIGHFPQREAPMEVANVLVPFLSANNFAR